MRPAAGSLMFPVAAKRYGHRCPRSAFVRIRRELNQRFMDKSCTHKAKTTPPAFRLPLMPRGVPSPAWFAGSWPVDQRA